MLKTSAKSCGVREMLAFHFAIPFVKGMVAWEQVKEQAFLYIVDEDGNIITRGHHKEYTVDANNYTIRRI